MKSDRKHVNSSMGADPMEAGNVYMRDVADASKWYNTQLMGMSGEMLMGYAAKAPQVRYSTAYPTGAERMRNPSTGTTPMKVAVEAYCEKQKI